MAVLGGTFSVSALRWPIVGLLFAVLIYFWRPSLWGGEAYVKPVEWVTAAVAVGWLLHERHRGIIRGVTWLLVLAASYAISTASAPYADTGSWDALLTIAKILFFSFLTVRVCSTPRRLAMWAVAVLLGCGWMVKAVLASWAASGFSGEVRINTAVAQGGGANYIAWVLASTLPLLLYRASSGKAWQRWVAATAVPFWVASIVATGSRGGLIAVGVSTAVSLLMLRKFRVLAVAGAVAILLIAATPSRYWERISTITLDPQAMDVSSLARYQNVFIAFQIIEDYPLFGTGLDTFPRVKQRYLPDGYVGGDLVAHNTFLQMGSELGLPFLGLFLVFNAWVVIRLLRMPRSTVGGVGEDLQWVRIGMIGGIAATCIQMLKGDMARNDYFWWQYAAALAVLEAGRKWQSSRGDGSVQ
jgi:O-antigen ligase